MYVTCFIFFKYYFVVYLLLSIFQKIYFIQVLYELWEHQVKDFDKIIENSKLRPEELETLNTLDNSDKKLEYTLNYMKDKLWEYFKDDKKVGLVKVGYIIFLIITYIELRLKIKLKIFKIN